MRRFLTGIAAVAVAAGSARAADTTTYRFDVLGRLVTSISAGGTSGSKTTAIGYDPAGNRASFRIQDGATPPADPAPRMLNPVLNYNSSTTNVISLTTLAAANGAARITGFSLPSGAGSAGVAANGQSVTYTARAIARAPLCEPPETVSYSVSYTVQNNAGGASASGVAMINVTGPPGPRPTPRQPCP